jgi:hypothetical protein
LDRQAFRDIRELLDGGNAIVHLSAVSNDPKKQIRGRHLRRHQSEGKRSNRVMAAERGVKYFVCTSSCSMYGYAERGLGRRVRSRLAFGDSMFNQWPSCS